MLHLVVFLLLFLVLLHIYYLEPVEAMVEKVIPVSFPRSDVVKLPSQISQGQLDVQGPVLLGIAGGGADLTYVEANQNQILFNSAGYDMSSDAALYADDNGLTIKAGTVKLPDVASGPVDVPRANISFLKVARSDNDPYPSWTPGIHTLDLYANGTVGAGQNGNLTVTMKSNGEIRAEVLETPTVYGNTVLYNDNGANFLAQVDALKNRVNNLNNEINERNRRREEEAARRRARNNRRGRCTIL
jgi:hypothetical protein